MRPSKPQAYPCSGCNARPLGDTVKRSDAQSHMQQNIVDIHSGQGDSNSSAVVQSGVACKTKRN